MTDNFSIRPMPFFVGTSDRKVFQVSFNCLSWIKTDFFANHQSLPNILEGDMNLVSFDLMARVKRAGSNHMLFIIGLMECPLSEASTHILFILWMNIIWIMCIGQIDNHSHTGVLQIEGLSLSFS